MRSPAAGSECMPREHQICPALFEITGVKLPDRCYIIPGGLFAAGSMPRLDWKAAARAMVIRPLPRERDRRLNGKGGVKKAPWYTIAVICPRCLFLGTTVTDVAHSAAWSDVIVVGEEGCQGADFATRDVAEFGQQSPDCLACRTLTRSCFAVAVDSARLPESGVAQESAKSAAAQGGSKSGAGRAESEIC